MLFQVSGTKQQHVNQTKNLSLGKSGWGKPFN